LAGFRDEARALILKDNAVKGSDLSSVSSARRPRSFSAICTGACLLLCASDASALADGH
jgi:hypothetical protein